MKKYFAAITVLLFALLIAGAAAPGAADNQKDEQYNKQFNVKAGGTVTLDLRTGASIEITGWNKESLTADVSLKGEDADNIEIKYDQSGNNIEIISEYKEKRRHQNSNVKIFLKVPDKFNVDFSTMGGGVTITGVEGNLEGTTMGGKLDLSKLKGNLNMQTMGGSITLRDSEVDGKVQTMGGEVLVENVQGDIDAKSMGGKVKHVNVKGNKINVGREVNISTMGGELDIDEAPNGAKLKTMGGDISVNSANVFVDAETMGGEIDIKRVDGWVKAKTMGGDVTVKYVGKADADDKDITLTSLSGDVTLYVPNNFSMDVNVEIAYTKNHGEGRAEIKSDFNLKEDRTDEWENSHGSKRKYIYGTGSFNGGKNKVTIKTINGTVYLKKAS